MTGFLVDTSAISLLAPGRERHLPTKVAAWFRDNGDQLYISAMTLAELSKGAAKARRKGSAARADVLTAWIDRIESDYSRKVLAFDAIIARIAGKMDDDAVSKGQHPGLADIIIAATAIRHDLTVVTMNSRHFEMLDAWHMNPIEHLD